jgi:hypothetical protein
MSNDFDSFTRLPEELQVVALREGEARLQAQLQVATAADQRALSWGGLLIAAATGALGGGLALVSKSEPDYVLGLLAIVFSGAMMAAAWKALLTVHPNQFFLPGNKPANWLPEKWDCVGTNRLKIEQARREQAEQISDQIHQNATDARQRATRMAASFRLAKWTIWIGGGALLVSIVERIIRMDVGPIWQSIENIPCLS